MEKKQKTSLTWQLILTMVVIVAGTVAMCWFFNTTFLEKYYIFHKEKELKSSFDQVSMEVTAAVCRCFHPERIIRCFGRPMNGCSRSIWFFWEL